MDPKGLQHYNYSPLQDAGRDIRIVEILPGQFDDIVAVKIHHAPLVEPPDVADTRMTRVELAATLPSGWKVARTLEDRYLFRNIEEGTTCWEHPDPRVDKATYELPINHDIVNPHYEALSYVWGSDEKPRYLMVEVEQGCTQLPVTDSLMTAIRHLRQPNEARRLWVDAVCLNQDDTVELGTQVQRMGLIYKLAYRVVVWLGPHSADSTHALSTLDYLGSQLELDGDYDDWFVAPFAEEPTWYDVEVALPYSQRTCDAILALLQRPWFKRVWTVQEIQLGSTRPGPIFQCGTEKVERTKLGRAVQILGDKDDSSTMMLSPELATELTNAIKLLDPMSGDCFWNVLRFGSMGRSCQDARDIIYGIIGLLPKGFASKINVDYGRQNTAGQVYKKAFLKHAQHVERLELFPDLDGPGSFPDAPSWVPNWDADSPVEHYHRKQFATGTSRAHIQYIDDEPDLLEVLGVYCAVVSHVSDDLPEGLERQDAMNRVRQWQPRDLDPAAYRPTGEPLRKAYARNLIGNFLIQRFPDQPTISFDQWIEQNGDESLFGDCTSSRGRLDANDSMRMRSAVSLALSYCVGRAFIQTHEGYIGLAPAETRPGDEIVVFLGCSNPLVLRPNEGRYSVVGEAFVYGLDDATKLLGPLPEPWRVIRKKTSRFCQFHSFFNPQTGETTREDPRLGPLHKWSRVYRDPDGDDPMECDFFEHHDTGVVVSYDPRLEPEVLEKKGVQLKRFTLI